MDGPDALKDAGVLDTSIVIVPLGATEQHGPHLPFETDTIIAKGVCERLIARLNEAASNLDVYVLPPQAIGYSPEHMDYEGSKTLSYSEAVDKWIGIGQACHAKGVRRIVFMNAHGGNVPIVQIVCQELRVRHGMVAVATKWDRFIKGAGLVTADEERLGIHGGQIETSVMLALAPDRVDLAKAQNFSSAQSDFETRFTHLRAYGPHAFGWKMQDLNADGVTGDAGAATVELGEALLQRAVDGLVRLLDDVGRFHATFGR
ncbi:MAG: creatininase family protein [Pseudomonadota bacterium]